MTMEILKTRIDEILKKMLGVNEDGGIEIYTDYRERELSDSFLKEIFKHDNPREAFNDELADWAMDYAIEYGEDELEKDIREELTDEEEESDFDEVIVVVEKDWLFNLIKRTEDFRTDDEVLKFLQEEYTSDDSIMWYYDALRKHKVVMVDFN